MIYVDTLRPCIKNRNWHYDFSCHLFADTVDELHEFAGRIGLRREWFQAHSLVPHYDLTANKRRVAVSMGAVQSDRDLARLIRIRCECGRDWREVIAHAGIDDRKS
jgi:hypothetical protein